MRFFDSLPLVSLAFACAATVSAQSVLVVDAAGGTGSDFSEIQAAVVAASEGDTILIRSGTYAPVQISGKSLVLMADTGAFVDVLLSLGGASLLQVDNLSSAQSVTVRGVRLRMTAFNLALSAIHLENNQGTVWLEDVETLPTFLFTNFLQAGLVACDSAGVSLTRCTIRGSVLGAPTGSTTPAGIDATSSNLSLFDTTVAGANGADSTFFSLPQAGGPGVLFDGGTLYASGSSFTGGEGGGASLGQDGADGGDGLVLAAGAPLVRLLDTTSEGGAGSLGNGAGTMTGADGAPSTVLSGSLVTLPGTARSYDTSSPVRAGDPITETFHGQPGDLVVLAYSLTGPLQGAFSPLLSGSIVIAPPIIAQVKGTIGPLGDLVTQPVSLPFAPGMQALPIALQGAMISASGIFITSPSFLSLLDPSF